MYFFTFSQNNSGGNFIGPEYVIVRANNAEEANQKAQDHDVYFDGVSECRDCECCGDRWYPVSEYDATDSPKIYDEDIEIPDLDKEFSSVLERKSKFSGTIHPKSLLYIP